MSWNDLISIYQEGQELKDQEIAQGPIACPNDGEPLIEGPDGKLFCKFDGYRPDC